MTDFEQRLQALPLRVRTLWSPEHTAQLGRQVVRRRRRRFIVRATAGVLAASGMALVVAQTSLSSEERQIAASPPVHSALATDRPRAGEGLRIVRFTDGSTAEVGPEAELLVTQDTPKRVAAGVVNGEARFNVVSKPDRVFDVQVGKVRVKVVGTVFSVRALPARARVAVDKGKVKVFWPGGDAELGAGQSGIFPPDEPTEAVNEADAMPDSFVRAPAGRRTWRELAKKKDYKKAYTLLHSGKDPVRDEPADLMLAADVARLSGHPAQAVAPLRKICERYPSDPRAPLAAFTQGRVLLDNLGRAGEAAIAFQKAQKLWPGGPLFVDALAREAEAWKKAGQIERARSTARRYLAKYPNGRHAAKLKALLEADGLNDARSR